MVDRCVIAEYASPEKARMGLEVLEKRKYPADSISVVSRHDEAALEALGHGVEEKRSVDSTADAAGVGALLGGGLVAPVAIGTLTVPFFIAGPLGGMIAGAAIGGALGGKKHWGATEEEQKTYQERVEAGATLVIIHSDGERLKEAEAALATTEPVTLERFDLDERDVDAGKV